MDASLNTGLVHVIDCYDILAIVISSWCQSSFNLTLFSTCSQLWTTLERTIGAGKKAPCCRFITQWCGCDVEDELVMVICYEYIAVPNNCVSTCLSMQTSICVAGNDVTDRINYYALSSSPPTTDWRTAHYYTSPHYNVFEGFHAPGKGKVWEIRLIETAFHWVQGNGIIGVLLAFLQRQACRLRVDDVTRESRWLIADHILRITRRLLAHARIQNMTSSVDLMVSFSVDCSVAAWWTTSMSSVHWNALRMLANHAAILSRYAQSETGLCN